MKYRKAVFILTYTRTKKGIEYLILKRKLHWKGWEFPKGGVENHEKLSDIAKRELKEETGLKPKGKIKKFNIKGKYLYNKEFPDRPGIKGQTYSLFVVEVKKGKVKYGKEHSEYKWVSFKDAMKKLTWPNQKKCLKIVNDWLENESL